MKKVCLQAGHGSVTTGATGAPGERDWTTKIVPMVANLLRAKGLEVYETGGKADSDTKVTSTDWDYFLAVHYDADIYNDRGGFVDFPDPSVDQVNEKSKALAKALSDHYFPVTGIPSKPNRSNANTKFYYMWSSLTANTPCVLIECGVGWRKPEDYNTLRDYDKISKALSDGILKGLGLYDSTSGDLAECQSKCQELEEELDDMRDSRNKWRTMYEELEKKYATDCAVKNQQVESLQKTNTELTAQLGLIQGQYSSLLDEKNALQGKLEALQAEYHGDTAKWVKREAQLMETANAAIASFKDAQGEIVQLKAKLAKGLKGYSKRELIVALFARR